MRILPTRWHGLLDYLVAFLLLAAPALFDLPQGPARNVPMALGAVTILYSLFTQYEWGLVRVLPMRLHLILDLLNGLLLALSPWLFGFSDRVYLPHCIIGFTELFVTLITALRRPASFRSASQTNNIQNTD